MTLTMAYRAGLVLAAVGLAGSIWPRQNADASFDARVRRPAFRRYRPVVAIDEGHFNAHTARGSYAPFAALIRGDGCRVVAAGDRFRAEALDQYQVLVIANALGLRGVIEQTIGLGLTPEALDPGEASIVVAWVRKGGSLLLIADHAPAGAAVKKLAARFGVTMSNWWAEDPAHADPESRRAEFIVFDRANGGIADHPAARFADRVITFTGQSLEGPGTPLLRLSDTAREYPVRDSAETMGRSAAGKSQGLALEFGEGRVVVLGEAAMLTAQIERGMRFGMNREGYDNRQFALSVMRWLGRSEREPRPPQLD